MSVTLWIALIVVLAVVLLLVVLARLVGPLRRLQTQVVTLQGKLGDVEALQARVDEVNAAMSALQARAAVMSNRTEPANERPVGDYSAETRGSAA
ncbi:hypothetical protein GCM10009765_50010 [Fodinicola feengrottensis]|uniref:DUF2746 domain-containing protein n=1 Tax=Fodinicola feengrottensis TaxID=435914 RepID=A0ABP4TXS8_9ACTN